MRTAFTGPVVLFGNDNPQQVSETDSGPNIDYQSNALLDSRFVSQATMAPSAGGINSFHNAVDVEALSCVPQAASNVVLAAAQAPAALAFFTLASANAAGIAINIPLVPFGTAIQPSSTTVPVIALDFGFALATTNVTAGTANQITLTGPTPGGYSGTATYASRFFYPGQKILVSGAGNAAGTVPLSTTVLATDRYAAPGQVVQATGVVLMANNSLFAGTGLAVGTADQEYGVAVKPVVRAGAARVYDPAQMTARNVTLTAGSTTASGNAIVRGFDIYEQPMSEIIAIPTTATTNAGNKAFAYISSVQVQAGGVTTGNVSVGTGTKLGIPVRVDMFEYLTLFANNVQIVGAAGALPATLVTADQTPVATSSTGDVRGTYSPASAPNGTIRYVAFHQAPLSQAKVSSNIDFRGIVGVVQA